MRYFRQVASSSSQLWATYFSLLLLPGRVEEPLPLPLLVLLHVGAVSSHRGAELLRISVLGHLKQTKFRQEDRIMTDWHLHVVQ